MENVCLDIIPKISHRVYRFLVLSVFFLVPALGEKAQDIRPEPHPNHYIILVDASGSTSDSKKKKEVFDKALTVHLIASLYHDGFGQSIPAYDPKEDIMTLHQFGVVTGDPATAYLRLAACDFERDFIHPLFVRRTNVDEEALRRQLIPESTYNYTILSWAKQLALRHSAPATPDNIANRTFLIFVHDGLMNEHSSIEEIRMIQRNAEIGYKKAAPLIEGVEEKYSFTDGNGNNQTASLQKFYDEAGDQTSGIFIEAYEVLSKDEAAWETQGKQIDITNSFRFHWTKESGANPEGVLTVNLNKDLKDWMAAAKKTDIAVAVTRNGEFVSQQGSQIAASFDQALTCDPPEIKAALIITSEQTDPLLGRRTISHTYPQTIKAPPPLACTAFFLVSVGLILTALLSTVAALIYYVYYRFYATHFVVEIPGTLMRIRIARGGSSSYSVSILPQREVEALSVKLPSRFLQNVFYRGVVLTIGSGVGQISWSSEKKSQFALPYPGKHVLAKWDLLPNLPTVVNLVIEQGAQRSEVKVSYPAGFENVAKIYDNLRIS